MKLSRYSPSFIRRRSIQYLREVSRILRDLADDIDAAITGDDSVDVECLKGIARELRVNHETLLLLSTINTDIGRIQSGLN